MLLNMVTLISASKTRRWSNDEYGHERYTEKKWKEVDNTDPYNVEVHQNKEYFSSLDWNWLRDKVQMENTKR